MAVLAVIAIVFAVMILGLAVSAGISFAAYSFMVWAGVPSVPAVIVAVVLFFLISGGISIGVRS